MPIARLEMMRNMGGMRVHAGWIQLFEGLELQARKGISKNIVHAWNMLRFKTNVLLQTHKHQPTH